jgi:hypothetical protein
MKNDSSKPRCRCGTVQAPSLVLDNSVKANAPPFVASPTGEHPHLRDAEIDGASSSQAHHMCPSRDGHATHLHL